MSNDKPVDPKKINHIWMYEDDAQTIVCRIDENGQFWSVLVSDPRIQEWVKMGGQIRKKNTG